MTIPTLSALRDVRCYINGLTQPARSGKTYLSIDPYRGEAWAQVADAGKADVELAVAAARRAFHGEWATVTATGRGRLLTRLAGLEG